MEKTVLSENQKRALALFQEGKTALRSGDSEEAEKLWESAFRLDTKNWLIRKQYWAIKNPEKFYEPIHPVIGPL